jgi:hypothetical protein
MSHSGRRALAETAATLSGGSSCNKGKDKKKTSKKPGVKPKPTTSANKRGGGGYGHGHKQKGGNCDTYEITHEQANILFLASDMDPKLKDLNGKVMNAIFESLQNPSANSNERKVSISLTSDEKDSLISIVFSEQNPDLASIVQDMNTQNATSNANKKSVMNQLEIRLNRYNFMNRLKEEYINQLRTELEGLKNKLNEQDQKCPNNLQPAASAPAAQAAQAQAPPALGKGGKKSSFLKKK